MRFIASGDTTISVYLDDEFIGVFERRKAGRSHHWYFNQRMAWLSCTDLQELRDKSVELSMKENA